MGLADRLFWDSFDGNPSTDVAEIVSKNARLQHLHIALKESSGLWAHVKYNETQQQALEFIGPAVSNLHSLTLEGDLHFSDRAWRSWSRPFNGLRSLSIIGISLIQRLVEHGLEQLPLLKKLKLSSSIDDLSVTNSSFRGRNGSVEAFLSSLSLTELLIYGIHPWSFMQVIPSIGKDLRILSFHISENNGQICTIKGVGRLPQLELSIATLLVSTADLETIKVSCPELECLSIDVAESCVPITEAVQVASGPTIPNSLIFGHSQKIAVCLASTNYAILNLLAGMYALRHVCLVVKAECPRKRLNPPTSADVVETCKYFHINKRGCAIRRLTMQADRGGRWDVWEQGPGAVVMKYWIRGQSIKEIWNLETGKLETREVLDAEESWPMDTWEEVGPCKR